MPADSGRESFVELLARARVAILALAPDEGEGAAPDPIVMEAWTCASAAVAGLLGQLENQEDPLRALLAVDMALAIDDASSEPGRGRGKLVALLVQALSVLADHPPGDGGPASLPSRSPMTLANEFRALRGAPLLSGNIVFAIAVGAQASAADADESASVDPRMASSARRLRSYYQQGLIAWLGGDAHAKAGANRMGEVFARLHALSQGSVQESLWRAASCFAGLLEDPRWRTSTAIKRLLGQLDGQLKGLEDGHRPAPSLVQDLLFYLGEGHDVDATIGVFPSRSALLAAFTAPPRAHPDQPAAALALLNELLSISGQLMEALAPDESWLAKRNWLTERMLQVADGLGLLGVHGLRHRAVEEITLLRNTPGSGDPPPGGWGQVAERLHALGADLLTATGMEPGAAVAEDTAGMPSSGHIARRLEADLVHAEGVIQRLEQGGASLPAEPPEPPAASSLLDEAGTAAMLCQRLDELAGRVRSKPQEAISNEAVAAPPPAPVDHELLEDIARIAGDIDGARARLEQQVGAFREGLQDMNNGLRALREEFEGLRIHSEALTLSQDPADSEEMPPVVGRAASPAVADMRQRLDSLASRISTLSELRDSIESIAGDSRSMLVQQARDNVALAQCLMQTRMRPLDAQLQDLRGEIGERAADAGKQVLLRVDAGGLDMEPDKTAALLPVLRSLTGSLIEDSIEAPRARVLAGYPPGCLMEMCFRRRGADLNMVLTADCRAPEPTALAEAGAFLRPLGGRLELHAAGKRQTRCDLQMPLAPRVSAVLLVAVGSEILALPLAEVTAVLQLSAEELEAGAETGIEYQEQRWRLARLGALLALGEESEREPASRLPLVLMASGGDRRALMVDAIGERVDVVVRSVVPQLRSVKGLAGAAILGDGQVVLLLDVGQLMEPHSEAVADHPETVS
ncbi:MAG: chemotaxis protein CheW [Gammaproteobacteria bacterium]|nr:chemotaxis protein CheW [Gammaproteobacteria bacterium]